MAGLPDPVSPLSDKEQSLVNELEKNYNREQVLQKLRKDLQTAVEIELATLPIYLYTYYSINRQPELDKSEKRREQLALFANKAGGIIMSVAVEEMLHLSLACNLLFAVGGRPKVYGKSPDFESVPGGGTNLPYHQPTGPDGKPIAIKLEKLGFGALWSFLEIEYPKSEDDPLVDDGWVTIGDFYSYIRCLLSTSFVTNSDFTGPKAQQISDDYYSQNCIDTIYPSEKFDQHAVPMKKGSAARAAVFPNSGDSHAGPKELIKVVDKQTALMAIDTICDQGEGYAKPDTYREQETDDQSKSEKSHYYKFLSLQATLASYDPEHEALAPYPKPPCKASDPWSEPELDAITKQYPDNPRTSEYPEQLQTLSNLCNAVYQYMLLMTEATYTVSGTAQIELFNVGMHKAMIWILDKLIPAMSQFEVGVGGLVMAPTFENIDIVQGGTAKSNVLAYIDTIYERSLNESEPKASNSYTNQYQVLLGNNIPELIRQLPDIDMLGEGVNVTPVEVKHACMGLNACKDQGRHDGSFSNDCAGQGYCSTAVNHSCHTLNDCKYQGGCGLYGSSTEQFSPGENACKGHGSCATPINAERFATADKVEGFSVWQMARRAFEDRMRKEGKGFGTPPAEAYQLIDGEAKMVGPSYEFLSENGCVTACGSSGMSGAGSCS
jgi:hypothetical protein